ncbi:MAG: CAP domain-containing protein [Pseudomonadota bacterium]
MLLKSLYQFPVYASISLCLSACGAGNAINEMKINASPEIEESELTTECEFNQYRIVRTLSYINQVRSKERKCGATTYPPAPAVDWNSQLYSAAQIHSEDMSIYDQIDHQVARNSTLRSRMDDSGYAWERFSENVSGGLNSPEQAIDDWMASSGHCENIMNPSYSEIGMACAVNGASSYRTYWTLLLASPES